MVGWCSDDGEFLVATTIEKLADFAVNTRFEMLPQTVVQRARLQHLHMATQVGQVVPDGITSGLLKAAPRRGAAHLWNGRSSGPRAAASLHAARAAYADRLDHLLGGSTGVGAVGAAWALAKGRTAKDLLPGDLCGQ